MLPLCVLESFALEKGWMTEQFGEERRVRDPLPHATTRPHLDGRVDRNVRDGTRTNPVQLGGYPLFFFGLLPPRDDPKAKTFGLQAGDTRCDPPNPGLIGSGPPPSPLLPPALTVVGGSFWLGSNPPLVSHLHPVGSTDWWFFDRWDGDPSMGCIVEAASSGTPAFGLGTKGGFEPTQDRRSQSTPPFSFKSETEGEGVRSSSTNHSCLLLGLSHKTTRAKLARRDPHEAKASTRTST